MRIVETDDKNISGGFIIYRSEPLNDFLRLKETVHKILFLFRLQQNILDLLSSLFALPVSYLSNLHFLMKKIKNNSG